MKAKDGRTRVERMLDIAELFFPRREIAYVFEMGAKDCEDTLRLHKALPLADIYTFECNQETLPICRKAVAAIPKIHLTESAVSDKGGTIGFYPIDTEKTETVHKDGNPGASSIFRASGDYPLEHYVQKETAVPSTRLDGFMETHRLPGIDILWLDAQGAELSILKGLGKKLRTVRFIHTEVEFMSIYEEQPLWEDVKAFLESNGFRFFGFAYKGAYFGDAIFVNKDIAPRWIGILKKRLKWRAKERGLKKS